MHLPFQSVASVLPRTGHFCGPSPSRWPRWGLGQSWDESKGRLAAGPLNSCQGAAWCHVQSEAKNVMLTHPEEAIHTRWQTCQTQWEPKQGRSRYIGFCLRTCGASIGWFTFDCLSRLNTQRYTTVCCKKKRILPCMQLRVRASVASVADCCVLFSDPPAAVRCC